MAKFRKASSRIVEMAVSDVLKEDFSSLFGENVPSHVRERLPELRTKMAFEIVERAQRLQEEAIVEHRAAEHMALLDMLSCDGALDASFQDQQLADLRSLIDRMRLTNEAKVVANAALRAELREVVGLIDSGSHSILDALQT